MGAAVWITIAVLVVVCALPLVLELLAGGPATEASRRRLRRTAVLLLVVVAGVLAFTVYELGHTVAACSARHDCPPDNSP
ncbi:hypothetical protein ACFYNO_25935 [Kitasatospora sp. NPDC006697]|uniref:hypothetical protein n=1 Tax=Kitasatospora sp. NPDC006697 TaxID=3364020 RepID=UPI0036C94922